MINIILFFGALNIFAAAFIIFIRWRDKR